MTTPLYLLRCLQIGLRIADLDLVTIGMVLDLWTEKANDSAVSPAAEADTVRMADQRDFDAF